MVFLAEKLTFFDLSAHIFYTVLKTIHILQKEKAKCYMIKGEFKVL